MKLRTILDNFKLVGDDLVRMSTGSPVRASKQGTRGYIPVSVGTKGSENYERDTLHRIKFALAHGYLPEDVDHRDGDKSNNSITNLRVATRQQNLWNKPVSPNRTLPKGVSLVKNGRYRAAATKDYKRVHLGYFDTPKEASKVFEDYCLRTRGEFHK